MLSEFDQKWDLTEIPQNIPIYINDGNTKLFILFKKWIMRKDQFKLVHATSYFQGIFAEFFQLWFAWSQYVFVN